MREKIRNYIKILPIIVGLFTVVSYTIYETRDIIIGPVVDINYPQNGETVISEIINITGETKNTASLMLNGRPIKIDNEGNFEEKIILNNGYNTAIIEANDRLGKKITKKIEVMYFGKKEINDDNATTTETGPKATL